MGQPGEVREKMIAARAAPVSRVKMSEAIKASWATPDAHQKRIAKMKAALDSLEKAAATARARWAGPAIREKIISRIKTARSRRKGAG